MDTPTTESTNLDPQSAATLMAQALDPVEAVAEQGEEEKKQQAQADAEQPEAQEEAPETEAKRFTITVDGKEIEVSESELAEAYKSGLRQADYTRKTMEAAEQRKAAEVEIAQARAERNNYQQGLSQAQALVQAQLQEQSQTDWQSLIDSDPIEYMRQRHLYEQRQAQLSQITREQQAIAARNQQEDAARYEAHLAEQRDKLLERVPEWRDGARAKAERDALRTYLADNGFSDQEIAAAADHRAIVLSRKAMLYDALMSKANAAEKKVANLPVKVERAGVSNPSLDKRTAAFQRLAKSGRPEDAASVFASFL